jgi:allantoicase
MPVVSAFLDLINLAAERLGAQVVSANDEFFGGKDSLIKADAPMSVPGRYTERGRWVDGWETRRRRESGHDWCVVRLVGPGVVRGVDVDTSFFKGNHPEACAIDGCDVAGQSGPDALARAAWQELLPRTPLEGDAHNVIAIAATSPVTHVRLRIFPDGGVARLRVHGDLKVDWSRLFGKGDIDLAAIEYGGLVVSCSDVFSGSRQNLIMPGDARNIEDGWETRRRRGPGHDWAVVRFGAPGIVRRIEVDTRQFKGNAPSACSVEGCTGPDWQDADWRELLPRIQLRSDAKQTFTNEVLPMSDITYVRFNIYPDGGVARLRLYGIPRAR